MIEDNNKIKIVEFISRLISNKLFIILFGIIISTFTVYPILSAEKLFQEGESNKEEILNTNQNLTQDFNWGVLALNLDKSSYKINDNTQIEMAVLDNNGKTICDANLTLNITDPNDKTTIFTTLDHSITTSEECRDKNVTNQPDYLAIYSPKINGRYKIELIAETANGMKNINESFEVLDSSDYIINRYDASMRVYPRANYGMNVNFLTNKNILGTIEEKVPASFVISNISEGGKVIKNDNVNQIISWSVNLKAGESVNLSYSYDLPDISPEFYLMGPLEILSTQQKETTVFIEPRPWQIAVDAVVNVSNYDVFSTTSATCDKPTDTADGDIMFALVMRNSTTDPSSVPSDWALAGSMPATYGRWLYWKVADNEGSNYTWEWASGAKTSITITTYRGGFDITDPIDVVSNSAYTTSNTTVRAASMNVTAVNSPLLFFATFYRTSSTTFTKPSVPTVDWVEDYDGGSTSPDFWREVASMVWSGSGATGDMDATASATGTTVKHAFAVALNPPTISGTVWTDEAKTFNIGSNKTVHLFVNGSDHSTVETNASGQFSFTLSSVNANDSIIVYLDGEAEDGSTVTLALNGTDSIGNLDIITSHVSLEHRNSGPITNTDLDDIDGVDAGNEDGITISSGNATFADSFELSIVSGETYTPGGTVTCYDFEAEGTGTFAPGANAVTVSANWEFSATGTFTTSGTVTFDATMGGQQITSGGKSFYNIVFDGVMGGWSLNDAMATNNFTVTNGTPNIQDYTLTINGDCSMAGGQFTQDDSGNNYVVLAGTSKNVAITLATYNPRRLKITGTYTSNGNVQFGKIHTDTYGHLIVDGGTLTMSNTLYGYLDTNNSISIINGGDIQGSGSWYFYIDQDSTMPGFTATGSGLFYLYSGASFYKFTLGSNLNVANKTILNYRQVSFDTATFDLTAINLYIGRLTYDFYMDFGSGSHTISGDISRAAAATSVSNSLNLDSCTLNIGGSWDMTGIMVMAMTSSVIFNSNDAGETINTATQNFNNIEFDNASGGWTIQSNNMSVMGNFELTNVSSFTLSNGLTLEIWGSFTNSVGGAATTWTGSTIRINSWSTTSINSKNDTGDAYATLQVDSGSHVDMWYSSADTYTVDSSGSLLSQDHANVNGDLFIWGDYHIPGSITLYWNYSTDFDGTDLSGGSERQANIRLADGAKATADSGDTLQIIGDSSHRTSISRQSAGDYSVEINGGTLNAQYYDFDYLDEFGLNIYNNATVSEISHGSFDNIGAGVIPSYITVSNINSSKHFSDVTFDDNSDGADANVDYNVSANGANIRWIFDSFGGNVAGDSYDYELNGAYIGWRDELSLSVSDNAMDLGLLTNSAVNSAQHNITVTSTAVNGYTCSAMEDTNLISGANDIDDVSDGTVSAGSEEYGITTSGADALIADDEALSGVALDVASNAGPVDSSVTTITYKASIDGSTSTGSYSHNVTFTCVADF